MHWLLNLVAIVVIILKINLSSSTYINENADLRPEHQNNYVVISKDSYGDFYANLFDPRKAINELTDDIPIELMLRQKPFDAVRKHKSDSGRIHRAEERKRKLVQAEHQARLDYISKFLDNHFLSARYVKQEVDRIRKTGVIKDDLRKMALIVDKPKFSKVRARVIMCYNHLKSKLVPKPWDIWNQKTNNLVQHLVADYMNDGL